MASLVRWDPFRALRRREDVFEDLFRDVFGSAEQELMEPAAEVAESDGEVTVKMAVPGVEKEQIQISVDDRTLTVRGEVKKETEEKKKNFYRQEIRYGSFQRTLSLPCEVDSSKAKAELKNGMLKIAMPKSQQPKAQKIPVSG
jgi:HSP20 family protein